MRGGQVHNIAGAAQRVDAGTAEDPDSCSKLAPSSVERWSPDPGHPMASAVPLSIDDERPQEATGVRERRSATGAGARRAEPGGDCGTMGVVTVREHADDATDGAARSKQRGLTSDERRVRRVRGSVLKNARLASIARGATLGGWRRAASVLGARASLGVAVAVLGGGLDIAWHLFGVGLGIGGLFSPSHLMLLSGGCLVLMSRA